MLKNEIRKVEASWRDKRGKESADLMALASQVNAITGRNVECQNKQSDPRFIWCKIGNQPAEFLIDSGAKVNTVTTTIYKKLLEDNRRHLFDIQMDNGTELKAYATSNVLKIVCTFKAWIEVRDAMKPTKFTTFYVVEGANVSLLSFETSAAMDLLKIGLEINLLEMGPMQANMESFPKMPMPPIKIKVDRELTPVQSCRYNIPLALEAGVRQKISEMLQKGIIEPANQPTWISAMHVVPKGTSDFRIVVDLRDVNKAIAREPYPMPQLEKVFNNIRGARYFTKLDLKSAYHHIELHPESRKLTAFMTDIGVLQFTRLPFGINCAPELFQRIMESLFRNRQGLVVFLDDILIYAQTLEELRERTNIVMDILSKNCLSLNTEKCVFEKTKMDFIGFTIDENGLMPAAERVEAVVNFEVPKNKTDLRSFLGMAQFLSPFIKGLSTLTAPLRQLLAKNKKCEWEKEQQIAFGEIKNAVANHIVKRGIFDPDLETELVADASPVGLGAMLVQVTASEDKRLIACASKSLTETEQKYPQTQREALAIVWSVEKFYYYLLGKPFTLVTDHEALKFIFGEEARIKPGRIMSRAEGWALRLAPYMFTVKTIEGKMNIADPASRMLLRSEEPAFDQNPGPHELFSVTADINEIQNNWPSLTWNKICKANEDDDEIRLVKQWMKKTDKRWPEEIIRWQAFKDQLFERVDGIVMKLDKMVLPKALRNEALKIVHKGHAGMSKMKNLLRRYVWWLGMDRDVESFVKKCFPCQAVSRLPPPEPIELTNLPDKPWNYVAIDFHSPDMARHILVITDCYSRYLITIPMKKTNTEALKGVLERIFGIYGHPKTIKSDNGPPFNSAELREWLKNQNVKLIHTTPWMPTENGMVERQNQGIKKALECAEIEKVAWEDALRCYTSAYNSWAHDATLSPPAELFFGRPLQGWLPDPLATKRTEKEDGEIRDNDRIKKYMRNIYQDKRRCAKASDVGVGDTVLIWNTRLKNGKGGFETTKYVITQREGSRLTVRDQKTGSEWIRSTKHAIKVAGDEPENNLDFEKNDNQNQSTNPKSSEDKEDGTKKEKLFFLLMKLILFYPPHENLIFISFP